MRPAGRPRVPFIAMPSCMQQESDKGRLFNPGQAATIFAGENYRPPRISVRCSSGNKVKL
jgi:hypothetical protein